MKTEWDYTALADAYLKRPGYSRPAFKAMVSIAGLKKSDTVCDVGAGVAHLTLLLADTSLDVVAIEPNNAMRTGGMKRTEKLNNVRWQEGTGEATGQAAQAFDMVTFGSSFNVCDRQQALTETARILKPSGWFACMWNHRQLEDPIQSRIEALIQERVPSYGYGTRREDQAAAIDDSGLFGSVVRLSSTVTHEQTIAECVEAWRSHATLARQAREKFPDVVEAIENYLRSRGTQTILIPYSTNVYVAQLK